MTVTGTVVSGMRVVISGVVIMVVDRMVEGVDLGVSVGVGDNGVNTGGSE
jgi:hypothetical protein